jgi:hypothetical protein
MGRQQISDVVCETTIERPAVDKLDGPAILTLRDLMAAFAAARMIPSGMALKRGE